MRSENSDRITISTRTAIFPNHPACAREPYPNATAVGVSWLAGFRFEIKVIARAPEK